jgi:hypothetical protein
MDTHYVNKSKSTAAYDDSDIKRLRKKNKGRDWEKRKRESERVATSG